MTNIFAVRVEYEKKPYIFCVADSQSTSLAQHTKHTEQKLVQRGHNLIMDTGRADIAAQVYAQLLGKQGTARELAEHILRLTEDTAKRYENDDRSQTRFFVAGKENDDVRTYQVTTINAQNGRRGIDDVMSWYSNGSGASHVIPALTRDGEMGFGRHPATPLEALYLCFIVGQKADTDLGVNEKLQYGFVSPDAVRLLLPPGVYPASAEEYNAYGANLTGIVFDMKPDTKKERRDELLPVARTIQAFYQALETQMHRLFGKDTQCNGAHTMLKAGNATMTEYEQALAELKAERGLTQPLADAFMRGGIKNIVAAVRNYNKRQESFYAAAEKLSKKK